MTSKFIVNAFKARLPLRPSHQRPVLFWTIKKLEYPISNQPISPPILSFRPYSDSTSTPPFQIPSKSTEGPQPKDSQPKDSQPKDSQSKDSQSKDSQSSQPKDKSWFHNRWVLVAGGITAAGGISVSLIICATQEIWKCWYEQYQRRKDESKRDSAIYDKLKKGPVFKRQIEHTLSRKGLIDKVRRVITPAETGGSYATIIGEHGTGKSSLIQLAVEGTKEPEGIDSKKEPEGTDGKKEPKGINGIKEPKGIVYVDMPHNCNTEDKAIEAIQEALGWSTHLSCKPKSLNDIWPVLSRLAIQYQREYETILVLIIDNANGLSQYCPQLLDNLQGYATESADQGIINIVFVSSGGSVLDRMTQSSSWSRNGQITEVGDVSRAEALQYLGLGGIHGEQAEQIYKLVGGRMIHLKITADRIKAGQTFEAVRETMFFSAEKELKRAQLLPEHHYHQKGAAIIRELLDKGSISRATFDRLVGVDTRRKLLETNVFAFHLKPRGFTFQSTLMQQYCEKHQALWGKNKSF